jgi:hypothetical protein
MRLQASLKRSETSRRKIQSRFSVFTTSSQNKNPAPSVNPGTKQLWQTRCDISANGDLPQIISDGSKAKNDPPQKQTSDGSQPMMKPQKQTSEFINTGCFRNVHLTSSTTDADKLQKSDNVIPCWPRKYLTATKELPQKHNLTIPDNDVTPETHIWQPSTHQKVWRHLSGKTANKKADSIHHNLKEEPSALRSLSIFDSTETEHKMHNGWRPVVEIAICM